MPTACGVARRLQLEPAQQRTELCEALRALVRARLEMEVCEVQRRRGSPRERPRGRRANGRVARNAQAQPSGQGANDGDGGTPLSRNQKRRLRRMASSLPSVKIKVRVTTVSQSMMLAMLARPKMVK